MKTCVRKENISIDCMVNNLDTIHLTGLYIGIHMVYLIATSWSGLTLLVPSHDIFMEHVLVFIETHVRVSNSLGAVEFLFTLIHWSILISISTSFSSSPASFSL